MDEALLQRVTDYAMPWLRYVFTVCEIARTGSAWVLASGDDIAILQSEDGTEALPVWPHSELVPPEVAEGATPTAVGARELLENALPSLIESGVSVLPFPGPGDVAVPAEMFANDIAFFAEQRRDITAEIARETSAEKPDGATLLDTPDVGLTTTGADQPEDFDPDTPRLWVLLAKDRTSVAGAKFGEVPALALFDSKELAEAFAERLEDAPEMEAQWVTAEDIASRWLLLAFSGGWDVAMVSNEDEYGRVAPARLALDLVEEALKATAN